MSRTKHELLMSHAVALPADKATTPNERNNAAKVARNTATTQNHKPVLPNRRHSKTLFLMPTKMLGNHNQRNVCLPPVADLAVRSDCDSLLTLA